MKLIRRELGVLSVTALFLMSACGTPAVYRPEIDEFKKATTEVNAYVKAKQTAVVAVRDSLRQDVLESERPMITVSDKCDDSIRKMQESTSPSATGAADCRLELPDNPELERVFNPEGPFADSTAFAAAVQAYAAALDKVARSGDKQTFLEAANGLGDAVISLAGTAAAAAGAAKPSADTFTPVAQLLSLSVFYYLESKRAEALKTAALSADPWIEKGSEAVIKVLYSAQFEIANATFEKLQSQVEKVNEASPNAYVSAADAAINRAVELRSHVIIDAGAPFRKLPEVHKKLVEAFKDRERNIAPAIAAAKDLFNAARDAHAAIVND